MAEEKWIKVYQGLPGSGKSALGAMDADAVVSEDDYYSVRGDAGYKFIEGERYQAVGWMVDQAIRKMAENVARIAVTTCALDVQELAGIFREAERRGYRVYALVVQNLHGSRSVHDIAPGSPDYEWMAAHFVVRMDSGHVARCGAAREEAKGVANILRRDPYRVPVGSLWTDAKTGDVYKVAQGPLFYGRDAEMELPDGAFALLNTKTRQIWMNYSGRLESISAHLFLQGFKAVEAGEFVDCEKANAVAEKSDKSPWVAAAGSRWRYIKTGEIYWIVKGPRQFWMRGGGFELPANFWALRDGVTGEFWQGSIGPYSNLADILLSGDFELVDDEKKEADYE